MYKSGETIRFKYNADGLRVQKVATSTGTTNYTLHGKNIVHMTQGSNTLHFFYDANNKPAIVEYNGTKYAYVHNLQGDIVAILDSAGTKVVEYKYDAWGRPISKTGSMASTLGTVQPFRYRGYVYDEETGLYYLRSRYYCPFKERFINADTIIGEFEKINKNVYAYCSNSPIIHIDVDGFFADDEFTQPYPRYKITDIDSSGGGGGFLPPSLGTGNVSVYFSKITKAVDEATKVVIQYVGITNDMVRRAGEHARNKGIEIIELIQNMSRSDAKAVEQVLIEWYDMEKNGGSLLNLINSISNKNPIYSDSIERGLDILLKFFLDP